MRKFSKLSNSLTPIEYLEKRYPSPAIRLFAGSITVFLLGELRSRAVHRRRQGPGAGYRFCRTRVPYFLAVGVIILYTYLGGYLAVAYTDFFPEPGHDRRRLVDPGGCARRSGGAVGGEHCAL